MITPQEAKDLAEIAVLLHEAYEHYFEGSDGYHKSGEGAIELGFGNYFDHARHVALKLNETNTED